MTQPATLVVVTDPKDLPSSDLTVVTADQYLSSGEIYTREGITVVNLCRTWRYLSKGYYVSLLADARAQHSLPSVRTLEGIPTPRAVFRVLKEADIETLDEGGLMRLKQSLGEHNRSLFEWVRLAGDSLRREKQMTTEVVTTHLNEEAHDE